MKRVALILALVGLGLTANVAWTQEDGPAPKKRDRQRKVRQPRQRKARVAGRYAAMVKVCALTEDQQAKVAEINAAAAKAGKEWQEANAEKIKAAREKMKAARDAKDKEAMKTAMEEMKAVSAGRGAAAKEADEKILALLTDEQKATWQTHLDVQSALRRYSRAKLTDEQKAKAKEIVAAGLKDVDRSDKKAVGEAMKKIDEAVKALLTDEQREAVKPKARAPRPPREKRAKKQPAPE